MTVPQRSRLDLLRVTRVAVQVFGFLRTLADEPIWNEPAVRIEQRARRYLARHVLDSTLLGYRGFPSVCCVSRNATAIHGVPSQAEVGRGDIVSVDIAAHSLGWTTDAAWTYVGPGAPPRRAAFMRAAWRAFRSVVVQVGAGTTLREIAHVASEAAGREGISVIPRFVGHGIGRTLHEPPVIIFDPAALESAAIVPLVLQPGMVLSIEPVFAEGDGAVVAGRDGWSFETADRSDTAHFELTVVPHQSGCSVLQFDGLSADELPQDVPFGDMTADR